MAELTALSSGKGREIATI